MTLARLRLPGGTLKIRTRSSLRHRERDRIIPVLRIGPFYFCWWRRAR